MLCGPVTAPVMQHNTLTAYVQPGRKQAHFNDNFNFVVYCVLEFLMIKIFTIVKLDF
jgi:hypothetical protein